MENIFHYIKISDFLHTSGQPTEEEINKLSRFGFETVVNVRPEAEMKTVFDERELVQRLGMEYIQIPMTFDTLSNDILDKFFDAVEKNHNKKLLIHCHKNIRITGLLGFYRIIKLGWEKEKAFNEHGKFVEITPAFNDYIDATVKRYLENKKHES